MSLLLDSSLIVRAVVQKHSDHARALAWVSKSVSETELLCTTHALAETFSVMSGFFSVPHAECRATLTSIRSVFGIVELGEEEYASATEMTMRVGRSGGAVYDALHVAGFEKVGAEQLVHCDEKSFPFLLPESRRFNPLAE